MIKSYLRSNPYTLYLINLYHYLKGDILTKLFSDETAVKQYYKKYAGKELDLDNPQAFSEKLQWLKLFNKDPLKSLCADKYTVRKYVTECGYPEILNTLHGIYDSVEELDISRLPAQFVIKASHGSGWNIVVKNKLEINWFIWKRIMKLWLKSNIYWSGREWVYQGLKPRIIVEKYLEDEFGELRDYKFFCFNGEPKFMQLEAGRGTAHNIRNFYDMDWKLLPFGKEILPNQSLKVDKPAKFEQMIKIASDLSKPFEFVRVDFYQIKGKIYFGELTFFPAGGKPDFQPPEYDQEVGKLLNLSLQEEAKIS